MLILLVKKLNNRIEPEAESVFLPIFVFIKIFKQINMNSLHIFLGMVGPWQIIIIVALILLLFGGKKIPELMKGLGTGIKEFKDATKDENAQQTSKKETTKEDASKTE